MTEPHHTVSDGLPEHSRMAGGTPRVVSFVALLVAIEGIALVVFGIAQTVEALVAEHSMPFGAIIVMSLLYIGYGLWLMMGARALRAARWWPRALIVVTQVFAVVVSLQLLRLWSLPLAVVLIAVAVVIAVLLFSSPVHRHLMLRYREGAGDDA